jgi:hypothetical protein
VRQMQLQAHSLSTVASMFPEQSKQQVFARIDEMFKEGRLNACAVGVWLDALEQQQHVSLDPPSDARLRDINDRRAIDAMRTAGETMHKKYSNIFHGTMHEQARMTNFEFLDHKETDEQLNECAVCCVQKSQCVWPAGHFGPRGESPPDSECEKCARNFWNNYDSERNLALHRATAGECQEKDRAINERLKTKEPEPLVVCWGTSKKSRKK